MKKFTIQIREVHVSTRIVEANTIREAFENAGMASEVTCEYSHTADLPVNIVIHSDGPPIRIDDYSKLSDSEKDTPR